MEWQALVGPQGDEDRPIPLIKKCVDRDVTAQLGVATKGDVLVEERTDLLLDDLPRQTVGRNRAVQHASRLAVHLEDGGAVPKKREEVRCREPRRP